MVKKVYSFEEYDKYLCLKPSRGLYLVVLFLLLPFVIKLLTFLFGRRGGDTTIMRDIQNVLYPNDLALMLAFLSSMPALIFMYAWIRRKPGAPENVKKIVKRCSDVRCNCNHERNCYICASVDWWSSQYSLDWLGTSWFIAYNY